MLHEKFGETPELETVYIDEVPTCIMPLLTDVSTRFEDPDSGEGWPEGLPFERFLTATQSPNQVNNLTFKYFEYPNLIYIFLGRI